jgi:hypothetical protein
MANGHELDLFKKKYPRLFGQLGGEDTHRYSYLFEWTSPENIIILHEHKEPTLTYLTCISNEVKTYCPDSTLSEFPRPTKYIYNDIAECIADVKAWKGKEGVVIYSPCGQTLKKIKAEVYLSLHRLKGSLRLGNINHVFECFLASPRYDTYEAFFAYVESMLDYEAADSISELISRTVKYYNEILAGIQEVADEIPNLKELPDRGIQARAISRKWSDYRKTLAFALLDGKDVVDDKFFSKAFESLTKS